MSTHTAPLRQKLSERKDAGHLRLNLGELIRYTTPKSRVSHSTEQ